MQIKVPVKSRQHRNRCFLEDVNYASVVEALMTVS